MLRVVKRGAILRIPSESEIAATGSAREAAAESDSGLILQALGRPIDDAALDDVSPWRFRAALSPDMAADRENAVVPAGAVGAITSELASPPPPPIFPPLPGGPGGGGGT